MKTRVARPSGRDTGKRTGRNCARIREFPGEKRGSCSVKTGRTGSHSTMPRPISREALSDCARVLAPLCSRAAGTKVDAKDRFPVGWRWFKAVRGRNALESTSRKSFGQCRPGAHPPTLHFALFTFHYDSNFPMKASPTPHPRVSRRVFLQTAGLAGGGILGSGQLSAAEATAKGPAREVDVLVCGGGCAGTAAALAAARNGAKTLLVERAGFAGGIITAVGLPYFDGIADIADNRVIVRGIAMELLSKSGVCAAERHAYREAQPGHPQRGAVQAARRSPLHGAARAARCALPFERLRRGDGRRSHPARAGGEQSGPHADPREAGDRLHGRRRRRALGRRAHREVAGAAAAHAALPHRQREARAEHQRRLCRAALEKAHERGELPMFYGPGVMFLFASDEVYVHGIRVPGRCHGPRRPHARRDAGPLRCLGDVRGVEARHAGVCRGLFHHQRSPFIGVRETRRIVGQHVLTEAGDHGGAERSTTPSPPAAGTSTCTRTK